VSQFLDIAEKLLYPKLRIMRANDRESKQKGGKADVEPFGHSTQPGTNCLRCFLA
jgi:hypothetical protein